MGAAGPVEPRRRRRPHRHRDQRPAGAHPVHLRRHPIGPAIGHRSVRQHRPRRPRPPHQPGLQAHRRGRRGVDRPLRPAVPAATVCEPGDSTAVPTGSFEFDAATVPVTTTAPPAGGVRGGGTVLRGRLRRGRPAAGTPGPRPNGEIVLSSVYGARGMVARTHAGRPPAPDYAVPTPGDPAHPYSYDALGRVVRQQPGRQRPHRDVRAPGRGAGDEEDNQAGGAHPGTPSAGFDPGGPADRVQPRRPAPATAQLPYDVKGELVSHTDPVGHTSPVSARLLGRTIGCDRPEQAPPARCSTRPATRWRRSGDRGVVVRDFDRQPAGDGPGTEGGPAPAMPGSPTTTPARRRRRRRADTRSAVAGPDRRRRRQRPCWTTTSAAERLPQADCHPAGRRQLPARLDLPAGRPAGLSRVPEAPAGAGCCTYAYDARGRGQRGARGGPGDRPRRGRPAAPRCSSPTGPCTPTPTTR